MSTGDMRGARFFILLACISVTVCYNEHWSFFTFSQQWPPTSCVSAPQQHKTCRIPRTVRYWTIHGLWPSKRSGRDPRHCNNTPFSLRDLKRMRNELDLYWPNLYVSWGDPYYIFWKHEWTKHGTCAMSDKKTANQMLYFQQSIKLRKQIDVYGILQRCGIVPNDSRTLDRNDILDCIQDNLKVNVFLTCMSDRKTHRRLLFEVRVCTDKSLKLIDCPRSYTTDDRLYYQHPSLGSSTCPRSSIIYPEIHRR